MAASAVFSVSAGGAGAQSSDATASGTEVEKVGADADELWPLAAEPESASACMTAGLKLLKDGGTLSQCVS